MGITKSWKNVYDSVVDAEHTGDVIWQTGLNVTGKGEAEIHFTGSVTATHEIKITLDGNVLYNGTFVGEIAITEHRIKIKWNISVLVEYRVNNAPDTVYIDIYYHNN